MYMDKEGEIERAREGEKERKRERVSIRENRKWTCIYIDPINVSRSTISFEP